LRRIVKETFPPAPPEVLSEYSSWSWKVVWQWPPNTVTWRLVSPSGEVRFLKVARLEWSPSIANEVDRMNWASEFLPVPTVLASGTNETVDWMVTGGLRGKDATHPELRSDPERLVRVLAHGLKRFHEAPADGCPFDFRIDAALRIARDRVERDMIDPARDFHPEFSGLTVDKAVAELEHSRSSVEDLVVCHGDYCLPNVLIEGGRVTGYVDLGELGVADRWWDLAVATWSVTWNLGPGYEELFLSEYGEELDPGRQRFFRLLYDVVS